VAERTVLIKGGRVVDAAGEREADVLIEGGVISAV
jgi:dihydroorotase-like cyclic amidohydrolase